MLAIKFRVNRPFFLFTCHPYPSYQVSSLLAFWFHCGHLGFELILIYNSPRCYLSNFESNGLSVQEKKRKIDFQYGHHGGHLGFPIRIILAISDLKLPQCLLSSFESIGLSVQEKKQKIDFQDVGHLGFPIATI